MLEHPFKPGDICKTKEEFEAVKVLKNKHNLFDGVRIRKNEIVTVLYYKQDTSEWVSGGKKRFGIHHFLEVLYNNEIVYINFSGEPNKLVKLKC